MLVSVVVVNPMVQYILEDSLKSLIMFEICQVVCFSSLFYRFIALAIDYFKGEPIVLIIKLGLYNIHNDSKSFLYLFYIIFSFWFFDHIHADFEATKAFFYNDQFYLSSNADIDSYQDLNLDKKELSEKAVEAKKKNTKIVYFYLIFAACFLGCDLYFQP